MRYETTTTLGPAEALEQAERFFAGEFGLVVRQHDPRAIGFEGGGGHVVVAVTSEQPTTLDLQTREWDEPVQEFMQQLPR